MDSGETKHQKQADTVNTVTTVTKCLQGDHFPDHMKFPVFSSRGKQRLPGIECLQIWSIVVVSY